MTLGHDGFLDMTPKAQSTEEKVTNLDVFKTKNFCAAKETIKKTKSLQNGRKHL